jgi:hypothetical protein
MHRVIRCLLLLAALVCWPAWSAAQPTVAFFYGPKPPLDELRAFDWVVLEPDQTTEAPKAEGPTQWFAYVSVGEVTAQRHYAAQMPAAWRIGRNPAWQSEVIDQTAEGWPAFLVDQIIAPLYTRGWRHFFLDTLDSYQLIVQTDAERAAQRAGLVRALRAIKARYPDALLLLNRGFELLPDVNDLVAGVAAESLYARWNATSGAFEPVPEADRAWLLAQLQTVRTRWKLPTIAIDYLPAGARSEARAVAEKIRAHGVIPWVSTPALDMLGVGQVEVVPRKVLVLYDSRQFSDIQESDHVRYLFMPLHYLGLVPVLVDTRKSLPAEVLVGRYAGVISWLNSDDGGDARALKGLFDRAREQAVPVVFMSRFGLSDRGWLTRWGLALADGAATGPVRIVSRHPAVGFEQQPYPSRSEFLPLTLKTGESWLKLAAGDLEQDAVGITPWGGYALSPYVVEPLPGSEADTFWIIQPLDFLRAALKLPPMPVPDVTTENGRRIWTTHIDGDAFPSLAEIPSNPTAAEVMRRDFIERYRVPHTVSVVEAEVSPQGLFASRSSELENTARALFRLPHVEIASHTYSHPFFWQSLSRGRAARKEALYGLNLQIRGYNFSVEREIQGSIDYINQRLAPPGKRVRVLLWSGDCNPDGETVAAAYKAGVYNMNAGDTTITRSQPSWTRIAPLGMEKDGWWQTFAPNQNENVYTNDWSGPYWGFRRVIETFQMTDTPYRFKPINLYYHTYSASKAASIAALHEIYRWAMQQETTPLFASEYIARVLDFNRMVVARLGDGWRIRGTGDLKTVRLPNMTVPDLVNSRGVAGWRVLPQGRYLHLAPGGDSDLVPVREGTASPVPYLVQTNAQLRRFSRTSAGLSFELEGSVPIMLELADASRCTLRVDGQPLKPDASSGALTRYTLSDHGTRRFDLICPR